MKKFVFCSMILLIIVLFASFGCKSQTQQERIETTTMKAVNAIYHGDTKLFLSMFAFSDLSVIGKNERMIDNDVKKIQKLLKMTKQQGEPDFVITDLYNELGQLFVKVPLSADSLSGNINKVKERHLTLLIGPPSVNTIDKISGYELISNNSDSNEYKPYSYWKGAGKSISQR